MEFKYTNTYVQLLFYIGAPLGFLYCIHSIPTLVWPYKTVAWILLIGTLLAHVIFRKMRNQIGVKITGGMLFYGFIIALILFAVYYVTKFVALTDHYGFEEMLKMYEQQAKWIFLLICFLQPIALPLPEAVTVLAGSAILGAFPTFILAFVGAVAGIITMFFITKYFGERFVLKFVKQEHLERYHRYVRKSETLVLFTLFIIPILPDEIICVGAGLSGVRPIRFIIIAIFGKLITAFTLSYSLTIAEISSLTPTMFLIIVGVVLIVAYSIVKYFLNRREKKEKAA